MSIIEKITDIYENILPKNTIMLPHDEAIEYFERLLMNGNIITYVENGELLGFIEFWRISTEQFGRTCLNITLAHDEDLLNGNVALITRMWINPEYRDGKAFALLAAMFLARNKDASHFAAIQMHKKHKPIQTYTKEELLRHYN